MTVVIPPDDIFMNVTADFETADDSIAEYVPTYAGYVQGDEVQLESLRMKYRLASATIAAGMTPNENLDIWIQSPINQYAAFYYPSTAPTVGPNGIKWIISPAHLDTAFLQDISGDKVIVTLKDINGTELETESRDIEVWKRTKFSDVMFPKRPETIRKPQFDMFNPFAASMEIEITGNASCRFVVPGKKERLSCTIVDGLDYSTDDFYDQERDAWGDLVIGKSRVIETASLPSVQWNEEMNTSMLSLLSLQGKLILMLADDRDFKDRHFPFVNLFGKMNRVNASLDEGISGITAEMRGA